MRARILCAALALATLARPGAGLAEVPPAPRNPPYVMIRALQGLQEQIAHGDAAAQAAQPRLMAHIADQFEATAPSAWADLRNAHAAVLFLLAGGNPAVIRTVLDKATMPGEVDALLKGALAYGEGQDEVARALLGPIDPATLPTTLGGHLALVEASLLSNRDSAKAGKLLDLARLLVPGTLVEEAALRRQIFLLADTGALDKVLMLSRQYARRYRTSIFADNFRRRLMALATGLAAKGDLAQVRQVDSVLVELPEAERCRDYLEIARAAVLAGQVAVARFAADKAAVLANGERDAARATLYLGAVLITSDGYERGLTLLQSINGEKLAAGDVAIRDAALDVARLVRADAGDGAGGAAAEAGGADRFPALVGQAQASLRTGDALLAERRP